MRLQCRAESGFLSVNRHWLCRRRITARSVQWSISSTARSAADRTRSRDVRSLMSLGPLPPLPQAGEELWELEVESDGLDGP
jgi:hypothetical protein